jgi:iron complex transport system permease protein
MRPAEIPVGIVTAFVGAPVLVVLIRRRKVSGL